MIKINPIYVLNLIEDMEIEAIILDNEIYRLSIKRFKTNRDLYKLNFYIKLLDKTLSDIRYLEEYLMRNYLN